MNYSEILFGINQLGYHLQVLIDMAEKSKNTNN
jgi:hypothetical protein